MAWQLVHLFPVVQAKTSRQRALVEKGASGGAAPFFQWHKKKAVVFPCSGQITACQWGGAVLGVRTQ
jgi:hypothetical protein